MDTKVLAEWAEIVAASLWFDWKSGLTTGYWDEITDQCELIDPR
jgi:hypothetical protein